jgi:hypothetical protein
MAIDLFGEDRCSRHGMEHPPYLRTALLNRRWLDILRAMEAMRAPLWRLTPILDRRLRVQLPVALERLARDRLWPWG